MKTIIAHIFLCIALGAFAQQKEVLDTIYANEHHNVSLFFPAPIRQGITGAPNFTFSYNKEDSQYFGLLKASPGRGSSLLILTQNGQIYSYILEYQKELPMLNYFITLEESIGNEIPRVFRETKPKDVEKTGDNAQDAKRKERYFEELCSYYLRNSEGRIKTERKAGMRLRVKNIIWHRAEVFVVFEIENRTKIDFELDYLKVFVISGNKRRNSSHQKLLRQPVYIHQFPEIIRHGQKKQFVYVFSKFTLGKKERIEVKIGEENGLRYLEMRMR